MLVLLQQIAMTERPKVLVLGGTNFMGKTLLDTLATLSPRPSVVCINRGKSYWNNQARKKHPEVLNFYCDRKEHRDTTATIAFVSNHLSVTADNPWECVVDFSAFRWRDVQSVTKAIAGIAKKYVFISSDSIYNNSASKLRNPIREEQFDLEQQYSQIKASSRSKDTYGYNKMKCEIYLRRVKPLPYVCLRLPDVIGPFDNTERFWCTVKWVRECSKYPLPLTADEENVQLSFVDSLSVAAQIASLVQCSHFPSTEYNLCSLQTPTLKQLLQLIADSMDPPTSLNFKAERNKSSNHFYPSVECGTLSCDRAVRELGWSPLPLQKSVGLSVEFFEHSAGSYGEEKKEMEREFRRKVVEKSS